MPVRYAKDPLIDRSLRHSIRDGVAYSVMSGAGETYFSAFALFFKASTAQIGLLASLPLLVSSAAQFFSAWLSHRTPSRKRVILSGAVVQALIWLPLITLPILFPNWAVPMLIACIIVYHASGNFVVPYWSSLMSDLVPERRRDRYFARRTRRTSITAFVALITGGVILHLFKQADLALYGFISIFCIAAVGRCVSIYHLGKLHEPESHAAVLEIAFSGHWWQQLKDSGFLRFSIFFTFMQAAVAVASPFFAVYMLRDLHFSYVQFMSTSAASVLMQFLALNYWGRLSDVFGNRLILSITGFLIPVIPVLWLFSINFWYLVTIQLLSGLVWAGFNLSAGNFMYDLIPAPKRATYLAMHNILTNIGIFAGAMLGGYLGVVLPSSVNIADNQLHWGSVLLGVFLLSAVARFMVAITFIPRIKEVRSVRPMTVSKLVFRATRFNAFSGLIYDIIAATRRGIQPKK